nr:MAG TPA: Concanavalin A-like lectin/glucanase superfamily protein [Caudoviricetes sp.]
MNTLLLEHLAAVSKIAAYRQAREHQEGVDASQGYLTTNAAGVLFEGPRTFVCHFKYEVSSRLQGIAGFTVPMMALEIAPSTNLLRFYCSTTSATAPIVPGNNYQAVISYDGTTAVCYLNGSEAARFTVAGYAVTNVFRIGNPSYPPVGPVYSSSHFNYALSAAEVSALWNNGDPAGYVLPGYARKMDKSVELGPVSSWTLRGDVTFDSATEEFHLVSDGALTTIIPVDISNTRLIRTDCIYQIRFKIKGSGIITILDGSNPRPEYPFRNITATDEYVQHTVLTSFAGSDTVVFKRQSACDVYIKDISISIVGCIAEYLPQNLVVDKDGVVSSWLDSAKQLPLNDEYLPPLLEPIVIGDARPIRIMGENSYTWTGADDSVYTKILDTSRPSVYGVIYKINVTVSNYEAGAPYLSVTGGYGSVNIPAKNGTFDVIALCDDNRSHVFAYYGGYQNTDRRLTITINSIEPVVERGYDLTANGTPEIIYK